MIRYHAPTGYDWELGIWKGEAVTPSTVDILDVKSAESAFDKQDCGNF